MSLDYTCGNRRACFASTHSSCAKTKPGRIPRVGHARHAGRRMVLSLAAGEDDDNDQNGGW